MVFEVLGRCRAGDADDEGATRPAHEGKTTWAVGVRMCPDRRLRAPRVPACMPPGGDSFRSQAACAAKAGRSGTTGRPAKPPVPEIVLAEPFPEARRPAIKLWIDFGEPTGERKTSAQLTAHYIPEALVGLQVAAVVNFSAKQIGPFMSEVLVLGFPDADGAIVLVGPERAVPDSARLF